MVNGKITEEETRLKEDLQGFAPWKKWGPYLSERQWGTVREDYSENGDAWNYISHDKAGAYAYRWGEEGIAGISDDRQNLCFAFSFWNGKDPILKERLFGLTSTEGNHGEDVKEYAFYVDNTPSHSYMKYLYKYPHNAFPYTQLVEENGRRTRHDPEFELLDTGIFDEDAYFDIFIEYAKEGPEEIYIKATIFNRGSNEATLSLLPTLWCKNRWSFEKIEEKPSISLLHKDINTTILQAEHSHLGSYYLYGLGDPLALFTENETNNERLWDAPNDYPYKKDSFNRYLVHGERTAVNPSLKGTKSALLYKVDVPPQESRTVYLTLSRRPDLASSLTTDAIEALFLQRKKEADLFYNQVTPYPLTEELRLIQRQAFAGLLWNKQFYRYSIKKWLEGDPLTPPPPENRKEGRNKDWFFLDAADIFSMPDKWEYPWFAAWDLCFHALVFAMIDPDFAKEQLLLLTEEWYMAPNGQLPAYEWNFSDVNPPVQAWAAMRVYQIEKEMYGREDHVFLETLFSKLSLNFTWWVNRKDAEGRNIFEGGFLGLDNIGAFDRSLGPPEGGILEQPDGTGWMGMYALNLFNMALELAKKDAAFESMAVKYFEHFLYIAQAINADGTHEGLFDPEEAFYYGLLLEPDTSPERMRQRNFAALVPLFATTTQSAQVEAFFPHYGKVFSWMVNNRPHLTENIASLEKEGEEGRILFSFASKEKLNKILNRVLDESEFFSSYGIRSVSAYHKEHPFSISFSNRTFTLDYEPGESTTALFGGNSNWRGPIWFPLNYLLIETLQKYHYYYGDSLKIECPQGSKQTMNLWDISTEITERLISIFLKDKEGRRPLYGRMEKFQKDPHWNSYLLFHEYFHGDTGMGLGASNQTGWTALVAKLIHQYGKYFLQGVSPSLAEQEWGVLVKERE